MCGSSNSTDTVLQAVQSSEYAIYRIHKDAGAVSLKYLYLLPSYSLSYFVAKTHWCLLWLVKAFKVKGIKMVRSV